MLAPAARRADCRPTAQATPHNGGCTFAEDPDRLAPDARIIWHAALDPGTLSVVAEPADPADPDAVALDDLASWLAVVHDSAGREHAVLSDGYRRIRLDVDEGSLAGCGVVALRYRLQGLASAEPKILPLRRLLHLCRRHRFARSLFPRDPAIDRLLMMLRVHDALAAAASQRDIATALFGSERVAAGWSEASDSLRSRLRRLVRDARAMAAGGYRTLMRREPGSSASGE